MIRLSFPFIVYGLLSAACATPAEKDAAAHQKLLSHVDSLKSYARLQNANTRYAILIDMSIASWEKRFFLVDLRSDSVLISGMCAHGECSDYKTEEVVFSNVPKSLCSAGGRYKIGNKYHGDYGAAYKLHGLDKTNDKAFERFIVFHAHDCVTDIEGIPTCRSWGCPTVSPDVLKATASVLDTVKQPVLMWIYK